MLAAPAAAVKIPRVILRLLRAGLRRVFNLSFLAALSLLLGIGLGCLWERSMRVDDPLVYTRSSDHHVSLGTPPGRFCLVVHIPWGSPRIDDVRLYYRSRHLEPPDIRYYMATMQADSWLGFYLHHEDSPHQTGRLHIIVVLIPLWFPIVLTLIAPLCWLRRWRRQARRVRLGLCLHCGYDLRSTPDATGPRVARCPECGRESGK